MLLLQAAMGLGMVLISIFGIVLYVGVPVTAFILAVRFYWKAKNRNEPSPNIFLILLKSLLYAVFLMAVLLVLIIVAFYFTVDLKFS